MEVIAVANPKGGCGKTTLAVNLAASLGHRGRRVLLVDMDPQGHAALALGVPADDRRGLFEVVIRSVAFADVVLDTPAHGVKLVPGTPSLSALEALMAEPNGATPTNPLPEELGADYDYVVVDCPPSLGPLTCAVLRGTDRVVVPLVLEPFSFDSAGRLRDTLALLADRYDRDFIVQLVPNRVDLRPRFAREMLREARERFAPLLSQAMVHETIRLPQAARAGVPLRAVDARCAATLDFDRLAREILGQEVHRVTVTAFRGNPTPAAQSKSGGKRSNPRRNPPQVHKEPTAAVMMPTSAPEPRAPQPPVPAAPSEPVAAPVSAADAIPLLLLALPAADQRAPVPTVWRPLAQRVRAAVTPMAVAPTAVVPTASSRATTARTASAPASTPSVPLPRVIALSGPPSSIPPATPTTPATSDMSNMSDMLDTPFKPAVSTPRGHPAPGLARARYAKYTRYDGADTRPTERAVPVSTTTSAPAARRPAAVDVVLQFRAVAGHEVRIAGDFNDWIPDRRVVSRRVEGTVEKILVLAPGRYQYRLVVDGVWGPDPANPDAVLNAHGGRNSVLHVGPEGTARAGRPQA